MVDCWIRSDSLLRQQRRPKRRFARPGSHLPLTREMLTRNSPAQQTWHKTATPTPWRAGRYLLSSSARTRRQGSVSHSKACTTLPVECSMHSQHCMMATAHLPTSCSWQLLPSGPPRVPSRHCLMWPRHVEHARSPWACARSLQLLQTSCVHCCTLASGSSRQGSHHWANVGYYWISQFSRFQVRTGSVHHHQTTTRALRLRIVPHLQRSFVLSIAIPSTASRVASAPKRAQKRLSLAAH
mmetsp:Transcript_19081/g.34562  ORF Transcript_19081/g.34562 Transcript_19081/m.34562 type:complete len:240 (+) Transcript_19081:141-860(+)